MFFGRVFRRGGGELSTTSFGMTTPTRCGLLQFPDCLGWRVKAPDKRRQLMGNQATEYAVGGENQQEPWLNPCADWH